MIREAIGRIFAEYPNARDQQFTGHPLAEWIRHDLPRIFKEEMVEFGTIIWVASAGQGKWADAPWIAAFNPLVTETAQEGFYPVYLFNRALDLVYLSLNQGMARLRDEFGAKAKDTLAYRASVIRAHVSSQFQGRFSDQPIHLGGTGAQSRLAYYEPGHAFGVRYTHDDLPSQEDLAADLSEMLVLYERAIVMGGTQELDTTGHAVSDQDDEYSSEGSLEEKRKLRLHLRIERNQNLARLAKEAHGYLCEVCGFNFERTYGTLGRQYIEAHHLTPLSNLPPGRAIALSPRDDFAVVCANCHRMIHRRGAPRQYDEFVALFRSQPR